MYIENNFANNKQQKCNKLTTYSEIISIVHIKSLEVLIIDVHDTYERTVFIGLFIYVNVCVWASVYLAFYCSFTIWFDVFSACE